MKPTPEMIEAAAKSDALFDGRGDLVKLSRADKSRYLKRSEAALQAALAAMWSDDMDAAPEGDELLLFCPDLGCPTNRERVEIITARYKGSYHPWATKWARVPFPEVSEEVSE